MDAATRDQLLSDPAVQEAVRTAGGQALSDPVVQQQILDTCREKFPEVAAQCRDSVVEWASDPLVQDQARLYAGVALQYAEQLLGQSVDQVVGLIEQGPAGIRILAFCGGMASCTKAALAFSGVLNPVSAVTNVIFYVMHGYLAAFATTTMLFEAKPEWIGHVPGLDQYQNMLLDKAQFLSEALGRGLFYGFQGTLWLSCASLQAFDNLVLGLWFLALAVVHILMYFGVMPQEIASKMRSVQRGDYMPVSGEEFAPPMATADPKPAASPLLEVVASNSRTLELAAPAASAAVILPKESVGGGSLSGAADNLLGLTMSPQHVKSDILNLTGQNASGDKDPVVVNEPPAPVVASSAAAGGNAPDSAVEPFKPSNPASKKSCCLVQ